MLSKPGAGAAKVVAATEYELMAKVLLIEDDSEICGDIDVENSYFQAPTAWRAGSFSGRATSPLCETTTW